MRTGTANTPPTHQTALNYAAAVPDGGRLDLRPLSQGNAKARPFRCAGSPGRHERFRRQHPKAPGLWDDPIDDPGLERFVRLGGTTFGGICGLVFSDNWGMAGEQKENLRIVTLKWCVAEYILK